MNKLIMILMVVGILSLISCSSDTTGPEENEVQQITIDASSYTDWIYFSFEAGGVIDPNLSTNWDIAFNRYKIKTNSGTSGDGNCGVADLGSVDFSSIEEAPQNWYTIDDSVTIIMQTPNTYSANKVFEEWYNMDGMPPTLTSKNHIYIVKTANCKYAKMKITNYYDPISNTSGFISFDYLYDIPEGTQVISNEVEVTVDATNDSIWVYYDFYSGNVLEVEEPENSTEWDIAFNRFKIKTNSGTSGSLGFGTFSAGMIDFESYRLVPAAGYIADEMLIDPMSQQEYSCSNVLQEWYNMEGMPPVISSKNEVYVIQNKWDKYVKIQILNYYDENNISGHITFKYETKLAAEY